MKCRTRIYYTQADKALMWERWRQGESLNAIARLFDRNHSAVGGLLSRSGGIRPRPRRRSARALAFSEREEISRGVIAGLSVRAIARSLRRAPSTVSREICCNGGREGYRASEADTAAWDRAERYRTLFIQARGALKKELLQQLRRTGGMRRSRHHTQKTPDHGRISETVSIRERPAEAEDRAAPGHWEGDLFFGSHNSQLASLVERQTRYLMLVKVAGKDTETVVDALI
jgi:IS30 family transposase